MNVSPTEDQILTQMRSFLTAVLPSDWAVVAGGPNRVPEPSGTKYVVMQPPRFERLRTNVDSSADVRFAGSIVGAAMTVSDVSFGTILIGATVFGVDVAANTTISAQVSGPTGGAGVYTVAPAQTVTSQTLSAGQKLAEQGSKVTVQLDFHAADGTSGDAAQTVSTMMRDEYATEQFAGQSPNYGVTPLLADDPRQVPFLNSEQAYEFRWIVEAMLQADQVVLVPQQFADSVKVEIIDVDATYPAV